MPPARRPRETVFQVRCETSFGAEVRLVGSTEALGQWDPARGLRLETSPKLYPSWRSRPTALLEEGEVEYKYVIAAAGQEVAWERCPNRRPPPLWREASEDCLAVLIQHCFGDPAEERAVQLRPFPDRRAFSCLRKAASSPCRGAALRACCAGLGCHEEPAGGRGVLEELVPDSCSASADGSSSGVTRASSSDSMNLLDEVAKDERGRDRQQLLVWPPGVFAGHVDVLGSFTQPPWGRPLALHLCPETGVWWLAVEEALPGLQPGTYEFKFRRNGQDWAVNPALPVRRTSEGAQNNTLVIDRRLMARIERRAGQAPAAAPPRGPVGAAAQLPSAPPPAACRGVALAEEGSDAAGFASGRPDDHSADLRLAPRRAVSTAERLWNGGDDGGGPGTPDWQQRTASMPRLANGGCRGSLPLDVLGGLSGVSEEEGDLYGTDVSLLLELPDVKRCTGLALVAGAFNRPKDGTVGEDAYFMELPFLGVADGVGGMQHVLGHSSKAFAEALMSRCRESSCEFAAAAATGSPSALGPGRAARQVLCEGYREVQVHGASTAVISWLDSRTNKLGVAVLGDSGVMVVRRPTSRLGEAAEGRVHSTRSSVVFKSPSQQHDFNYPYQLCRLPAAFRRLQLRGPDKPTDCAVFEVDVEEGDLILCYSDGVDDNLYDQEILDICDRALSPYAAHVLGLPDRDATPPELVSRAVGAAAYTRSRDQKARVPFADAARKAGWPTAWCRGGKEDDITCLAAWVQHQPTGAQATPGRGA